jgi:predicted  nucleic acid-binding Zn-ribbon protein
MQDNLRYYSVIEEGSMKATVITPLIALALNLAVSAAAQQPPAKTTPAAPATLDEVLVELRALRAELNETATASLRAQLLVARLALQEQRITVVGKELADVQEKLRANEQQRPIANLLKSVGGQAEAADTDRPQEANFFLDAIRGQAEQLEKSDEELKARHAELSRVLAEEQSRWTTFNARLEALEKGRK